MVIFVFGGFFVRFQLFGICKNLLNFVKLVYIM